MMTKVYQNSIIQAQIMEKMPKIEVQETDVEVLIRAYIPGVSPKNLKVDISKKTVRIAGKVEGTREIKKEGLVRKESRSFSFQRIITLPCEIEQKAVKANIKNGVLTMKLAKKQPGKPHKMKKIPIEGA
jgi:HSP20 family protein